MTEYIATSVPRYESMPRRLQSRIDVARLVLPLRYSGRQGNLFQLMNIFVHLTFLLRSVLGFPFLTHNSSSTPLSLLRIA
jgi:hypothetical protein